MSDPFRVIARAEFAFILAIGLSSYLITREAEGLEEGKNGAVTVQLLTLLANNSCLTMITNEVGRVGEGSQPVSGLKVSTHRNVSLFRAAAANVFQGFSIISDTCQFI